MISHHLVRPTTRSSRTSRSRRERGQIKTGAQARGERRSSQTVLHRRTVRRRRATTPPHLSARFQWLIRKRELHPRKPRFLGRGRAVDAADRARRDAGRVICADRAEPTPSGSTSPSGSRSTSCRPAADPVGAGAGNAAGHEADQTLAYIEQQARAQLHMCFPDEQALRGNLRALAGRRLQQQRRGPTPGTTSCCSRSSTLTPATGKSGK